MVETNGNAAMEVATAKLKDSEVESSAAETDAHSLKGGTEGEVVPVLDGAESKGIEEESNTEAQHITPLDKQIIRQIEYYFGDVNLARDKFLQEQIKLDEGWIPLDIMMKFKRLAQLSTDAEVILSALEKSPQKLMEISSDRRKIRRSPKKPLPILNEQRRQELMSRTVYAKGFPTQDITLDMLLEYFGPHGPIENLQMRTMRDKATNAVIFKGSVYVMFNTIEQAKVFMDLDSVKYEDTVLVRKWQADHLDQKKKEREERRCKGKPEAKKETEMKKKKKEEEEAVVDKNPGFPKGCLLHMTGFSGEVTREDIKSELAANEAEVAFVHFSRGDTDAWVRLVKDTAAKELMEKLEDGKMEVCGSELEVRQVEGVEEEEFLAKTMNDLKERRSSKRGRGRGGRGGRGGGFRGGRHQNYKRRGSPTRGEGSKVKKT